MTEPMPAHYLIVNVALADVTEENGSIELWPGSHLTMSNTLGEDIKVDPEFVKSRRQTDPPVRGNTAKGSVLIRDNRLWHRGTPNRSTDPRFMIALIHSTAFMQRSRKTVFSNELAGFFAETSHVTNYRLTDQPISYLTGHKPYDYPTKGAI